MWCICIVEIQKTEKKSKLPRFYSLEKTTYILEHILLKKILKWDKMYTLFCTCFIQPSLPFRYTQHITCV